MTQKTQSNGGVEALLSDEQIFRLHLNMLGILLQVSPSNSEARAMAYLLECEISGEAYSMAGLQGALGGASDRTVRRILSGLKRTGIIKYTRHSTDPNLRLVPGVLRTMTPAQTPLSAAA